jgi:transposase
VELAETIGTDGRRLFELVYAESNLRWVRELEAIETLRRVWVQNSHAHEQQSPWRAEDERPAGARLITSPYDTQARYSRKRGTDCTG